MILDDLDSRPGSTTSLLRTVVGLYVRDLGGAVAVADLVDLLGALGVPPAGARSAVSRVKAKGLLVPETLDDGRAGYRLAPDAGPMLARGDRRIFGYRQQGGGDPWCLVSYSLPEERRDARHQLRRHLAWIGAGSVADGLWITPGHLVDEVEEILVALEVRDAATVFLTGAPRVAGSFADAAARWWDLDRVAALHRTFLARHDDAGADGAPSTRADEPRDAFARWVRAVDDWRPIPYADPGLPSAALPADWPGTASVALFDRLGRGLADAASRHVRVVVGRRGEHSEGMSDVTQGLPAAVRTLVEATNAGDTTRFLTAFTEDAVLDDGGRRFRGRTELASWDRTDNIGKRSHFDVSGLRPGAAPDEVLLDLTVSGDGYNGPGTFTVRLRDGLIASLVIS